MRGTIYLIRNLINDKKYVGQSTEIERRIRTHVKCKSGYLISSAIAKYGIENFEIILLADYITTHKELDELEKYYIKEYNCLAPHGYNLRTGKDDGVKDTRLTPEQEQQIVTLYNNNTPVKEISKMFEMSIGGIVKCLSRNNVPRRKPITKRRVSKIDYDTVITMLNDGYTQTEIAKVFNTNYKYIHKYIKQKNIILNPREVDSLEVG